jgi:hypothetical protein
MGQNGALFSLSYSVVGQLLHATLNIIIYTGVQIERNFRHGHVRFCPCTHVLQRGMLPGQSGSAQSRKRDSDSGIQMKAIPHTRVSLHHLKHTSISLSGKKARGLSRTMHTHQGMSDTHLTSICFQMFQVLCLLSLASVTRTRWPLPVLLLQLGPWFLYFWF